MANEKRLIDAEKFLQWVVKRFKCVPLVGSCDNDSEDMRLLLAQAPTVDAVEVVRCKDCKHWSIGYCNHFAYYSYEPMTNEDDFCSYGERKDNGNL